jgi:hypothetical protein
MKYLNSRDNYLKSLNERRVIEINNKLDVSVNKLIQETTAGSGALGNEVKWGDSLVGRFLHNIIRKAQNAANLKRISSVVARLRTAMDDLLVAENLNDLTEVDKAELNKAVISEYLDVLQQAVIDFPTADKASEYYTLESIKDLTNDTIGKLEGTTALPYLGTGFENKNEILRQLKKWKQFLDGLEFDSATATTATTATTTATTATSQSSAMNAYRKNFVALMRLLLQIKKLLNNIAKQQQTVARAGATASGTPGATASAPTTAPATATKDPEVDKKYQELLTIWQDGQKKLGKNTNAGEGTRAKLRKEAEHAVKVDKKAKELLAKWQEDQKKLNKNTNAGEGTRARLRKEAEMFVKESLRIEEQNFRYFIFENTVPATPVDNSSTPDENSKGKIFSTAKNLWGVLSKVLGKEELEKNITKYIAGVDADGNYIGNYPMKFLKIDAQIKRIYEDIRKKSGVSNESMVDILNDHSAISAGIKSIYDLIKGKNGVVEDSDLGLPMKISDDKELKTAKDLLKKFNDTFKPCLEVSNKATDETSTEEDNKGEEEDTKQESRLFKYSKFISLINEATKYTDRTKLGTDLTNWWNNKLNFQQYILTKQQAEVTKENLEKKLASEKDAIVIMGLDPVLEIVKCFNRAYKIHTTQVIRSGRSDGQVTNRIFMEYTCFGNGSPKNAGEGGGPYRNNRLFDTWESNVLDILKDKQYQKIFNVKTRLKVGDEYIDKAGSNLRKFMTDMLNGDEFYGKVDGKDGGLQAKFLDKYFGYKDGDDAKNTHFGEESERQNNQSNTPDPMQVALDTGRNPIAYSSYSDLKGTFFALTVKESGSTIKYYFYIQDYRSDIFYVSFCQSAFYLKEYLIAGNTGRSVKLDTSTSLINVTTEKDTYNSPYLIKATKIKASDLYSKDGKFTSALSGSIKSSWLERDDPTGSSKVPNDINHKNYDVKEESLSWNIIEPYHVIDKATKDRASVKRLDQVKTVVSKYGGYDDIANMKEIANVKIG